MNVSWRRHINPSTAIHDHRKHGPGPLIWLNRLDLPLFQHLPVHFAQSFSDPRYPAEDGPTQLIWQDMKLELDREPEP